MSDETRAKDPGAIWRDQPEEKLAVTLEQIVNLAARAGERPFSAGWIRRRDRLGRHIPIPVPATDLAARFAAGRDRRDWSRILPQGTGRAARSPEARLDMARATASGVHNSPGDLAGEHVFRLPASAQRAASRRPAGGLDRVRHQAPPPAGQRNSAGDRRNVRLPYL